MSLSQITGGEKPLSETLTQDFLTVKNVYTPDQMPGFVPMTEIDIILGGSGIHRFFGQSVPCSEGDIYILQENVPHGFYAAEEDGTPLSVRRVRLSVPCWFDGDHASVSNPAYLCGVFAESSTVACAVLTQDARREASELLDRVFAETRAQKYGWRTAVSAYLSVFFVIVSRCRKTELRNSAPVPLKERGIILSVLRAVDEHYGEPELTLERLAAAHFMSTSGLSRLFGQYIGQPFSEYIRHYRMEQACRLLRESQESVNTVASHCGIRDIPSFYRAFSRYTGMTPNRYRKEYAAAEQNAAVTDPLDEISSRVQTGRTKDLLTLISRAMESGIAPEVVLYKGLVAGMDAIGEKFKNNEVYVPEVLLAARSMNAGLQLLKPFLQNRSIQPIGKAVLCTVRGDMHDIGKNLVRMMLEGKGIECVDLGVDVDPARVVEAVRVEQPDLVCLSALLTTTLPFIGETVEALKAAGLRDRVRIMIGGAPVSQEYADEIGADAYTPDASSAADAAARLLSSNKSLSVK